MSENMFPILFPQHNFADILRVVRQHGSHSLCLQIPWGMIDEHEDQAIKNHSQSINRLAQRGGLSTQEALAVLEDRPWKNMGYGQANAGLIRAVERWQAREA